MSSWSLACVEGWFQDAGWTPLWLAPVAPLAELAELTEFRDILFADRGCVFGQFTRKTLPQKAPPPPPGRPVRRDLKNFIFITNFPCLESEFWYEIGARHFTIGTFSSNHFQKTDDFVYIPRRRLQLWRGPGPSWHHRWRNRPPKHCFFFFIRATRGTFRVTFDTNGVAMARHGPRICVYRATAPKKLLNTLRGFRDNVKNLKTV